MVSYVLLISIAIAVSAGVFVWLRSMANIEPPVDCDEGTSLILYDYKCSRDFVNLTVKNNGRFNVDGLVLIVSPDKDKAPTNYLIPQSSGTIEIVGGSYLFRNRLPPGETTSAEFYGQVLDNTGNVVRADFNEIKVIQIQPFVIKKGKRVLCQEAVIRQEIENCQI
jgi:hypothetical protein